MYHNNGCIKHYCLHKSKYFSETHTYNTKYPSVCFKLVLMVLHKIFNKRKIQKKNDVIIHLIETVN